MWCWRQWNRTGGKSGGREGWRHAALTAFSGALAALLLFSALAVLNGRAAEDVSESVMALRAESGSRTQTKTPRANQLAGPVPAELVEVIDGDTLRVRAKIWLGQEILVLVRLRGVDTPELRGKCDREKQMARAARELVSRLAAAGPLSLTGISGGKYYGRVVASVTNAQGEDLAPLLLEAGLARAYGGAKRTGWCATARHLGGGNKKRRPG
jgi:endonuclease YncB( thermonuclease family)